MNELEKAWALFEPAAIDIEPGAPTMITLYDAKVVAKALMLAVYTAVACNKENTER